MATTVETEIGGKRLILETGIMAKQAGGAVVARYGDTVVLATAVSSKVERENVDFLPLTVDYQEKAYSAGKIPGGFFKREGRQTEKEILSSRLIDRPLRPLFPDGYYFDTQVIASVLSLGDESASDLMGMIASSSAVSISDIPFNGPVGAVRVGYIDGKFSINPGFKELVASSLNLVVAGTADAIMMVEGGASELSEDQMLEALETAHREIKKIVALQLELVKKVGKAKRTAKAVELDKELEKQVAALAMDRLKTSIIIPDKMERQKTLDVLLDEINRLARVRSELGRQLNHGPGIRHADPQRQPCMRRVFTDFLYFLAIVKSHQGLVFVQFFESAPVFDRVGVNDFVPYKILARIGRQVPDVIVNQLEFRYGCDVKACAYGIKRPYNGRIRVCLDGIIGLHARQMAFEFGVVPADFIVIHDEKWCSMLLCQIFQ